ncbi:hypothetical protein BAUCODRAFT_120782 [Baudoinia panamericana UAMH 10762]|uniref:G protein-coupled receptor GPR1/2/3 C-terminal domain-containing protein n=1 Tax=Baudoinia panamericana (strain UAMH 10762) TaxID=717646 RepID=M2N1Q3_BAUPA|nr:uncharacterized protein BAUCODRAFT_120782 [Baudoinia panamericana UAMH 10762]EMC97858.1 hypothetical protein BAUCODRAFT_120782 [Baudoinia panamericana UAMH 10762]
MYAPYEPEILVDGQAYFPSPYSLDPLPEVLRHGLVAVGLMALISVASTLVLLCFIGYRFLTWRLHYRTFLGYNQYVVLVLNLLLADIQQSSGFLISFHWISRGSILAPSPACFAQGWLIHSGDVASGLFVLAIALHTFWTAVYGRRISNRVFASCIVALWAFSFLLAGTGVGIHGDKYFVRAGAWCWISSAYENDRLLFHYLWIFIIEFGTIIIYVVTFYELRKKTTMLFNGQHPGGDAPNRTTIEAVNRITTLMTVYPCVYVLLTLPLSAGRMWSMAHDGRATSSVFACIAGSLITSSGWVDSLLYTLTRKRLLKDTMPGQSSSRRNGDGSDAWEATELGTKGITHTRTVTVEGGQIMDYTPEPQESDDSSPPRPRHLSDSGLPLAMDRPPSPNGSVDPILTGRGRIGRNKTEITVGTHEMYPDDHETQRIAELPVYIARPD